MLTINKYMPDEYRSRYGLRAVVAVFMLLSAVWATAQAPEPTFTEEVGASMLVTSPGPLFYQATGHAAIRLQCPAFGLDNVFSFETSTDNALGQVLGHAKGRFAAIGIDEYLGMFRSEGREVKEYPLNLTDPQIRTLWRLLDEAVESGSEKDFNVRFRSCSSEAIRKITEALGDDEIRMNNRFQAMDNGTHFKEGLKDESPWSTLVFTVGLGTDCDVSDHWHTSLTPRTMDECLPSASIVSRDGTVRHLLSGTPAVLVEATRPNGPQPVTPVAAAIAILILSAAVSAMDMAGRWPRVVKAIDIVALGLQSLAALALIAVAVIPASIGSAWNWMFIPFNLLPLLAGTLLRGTPLCRPVFLIYSGACVLFIAAPLLTSEADTWSSILSAAIALRILSHFLK